MKNKIELINRISELEAKVEAANKLLDAFTYEMDMTEMADLLRNLRTALQIPRNRELNATEQYADACQQIDKQRKEECQVGGVPQNVPSCKELKPEVFRDCQGYTSKIVKKENTTP